MTRTEAIELITATLSVPLKLTDEELAGIEQAREDFRMGRSLSRSEARAMSIRLAAKRRAAMPKET